MELNRIPITIDNSQNDVVGYVVFTDEFESTILKCFKNQMSLTLGGAFNLRTDKLHSLSISHQPFTNGDGYRV